VHGPPVPVVVPSPVDPRHPDVGPQGVVVVVVVVVVEEAAVGSRAVVGRRPALAHRHLLLGIPYRRIWVHRLGRRKGDFRFLNKKGGTAGYV